MAVKRQATAFLSTCPQQGTSAEGSLKVTESGQSTLLCLFLQLATMVTCSLDSISPPKITTVFTFKVCQAKADRFIVHIWFPDEFRSFEYDKLYWQKLLKQFLQDSDIMLQRKHDHKAAFLATLSAPGLLSGPKSFTDAAQIILSIRKNKNNGKNYQFCKMRKV